MSGFSGKYLAGLAAVGVLAMGTSANAATLANYDIGDGSLGTDLFFDTASTGGNDETGEGYVMKYEGLWAVGEEVTITGIAIPVWTNNDAQDTTNNTTPGGTFTVSFYDLGADGVFSGAANETLQGTNTVDFNGGTPAVDAYAALFDTATVFTAESTGIAIHLDYSAAIRLKSSGPAASGNRLNLSNGAAQGGRDVRLSLSGTAVPEPSSLALLGLGGLAMMRRRRA